MTALPPLSASTTLLSVPSVLLTSKPLRLMLAWTEADVPDDSTAKWGVLSCLLFFSFYFYSSSSNFSSSFLSHTLCIITFCFCFYFAFSNLPKSHHNPQLLCVTSMASLRLKKTMSIFIEDLSRNSVFFGSVGKP